MARPLSLSMAGRARNTDGTHPRASSGARSVVSGPFPEVLPPAWRRASSACDRTDPTERSRSRPRRRWRRRHAAPRNLGRTGRAFVEGPLPDVPSGRRRRTGRPTRPAGRRDLPPDGARRRPGPGRSRRRTAGRGRAGPDGARRTAPDGTPDAADGPDGARRGAPDGSRRVPDRAPDGAGRGPPAPDAGRSPTRSPTGPTGSPTPWAGRGQMRPPRRPTGGARCCRWSPS